MDRFYKDRNGRKAKITTFKNPAANDGCKYSLALFYPNELTARPEHILGYNTLKYALGYRDIFFREGDKLVK